PEVQCPSRRLARRVAQRHPHACQELPHAERLGHIVVRAGVERLDLGALLGARREDQDRHRRPPPDAPDDLDAVDVGQAEVDDREVRLVRAGIGGTAIARLRLDHPIAVGTERRAQEAANFRLVLHDQDRRAWLGHSGGTCGAGSSGSVKRNAEPFGRRSAQIRPPCRLTTARQIARPSPTPPTGPSRLPRVNFSKSASGSPGGRPGPSSSTETRTSPPVASAESLIGVPDGVYLKAFSRRLASTCSISSASRRTRGSAGSATRTGCEASGSRRRASTEPTTSLRACQSRFSAIAPPSRRVICSTLATRSLICCECSK